MASSHEEPNLEDRLRGLILKNAHQTGENPNRSKNRGQPTAHVPPRFLNEQAEEQRELGSQGVNAGEPRGAPRQAPGRQKRPNQAQRRQMNAQMTIPIDPRPPGHTHTGRSPGFAAHGNSPRHSQGHQNHSRPSPVQPYSPRYHNEKQSGHHQQQFPARIPNFQQSYNDHPPPSPQTQFEPGTQSRTGNDFHPQNHTRTPPHNRQLFQPGNNSRGRLFPQNDHQDIGMQVSYLESLVHEYVPKVAIEMEEATEKEDFRAIVERTCQETITEFERSLGNLEFDPGSVELQCFGSMRSGFATRASDMDLALVAPACHPDPHSPESRIPRLLEKKLLSIGYGARLLTRTRVPIIKLCQRPTDKLLADLREARTKWDAGVSDEVDENEHDDERETRLPIPESPSISKQQLPSAIAGKSLDKPQHTRATSVVVDSFKDSFARDGTLPEDRHQVKLSGLRQQLQQSLQDHHNSAKRLLRRLGGRDITANSPELNDQEALVLDDVCRAFIVGIRTEELSHRLQQYPSIKPLFALNSERCLRSLQSIWTQAEGERLAMAFDKRPLVESQDKLEEEAANAVEAWYILQEKMPSPHDSGFFSRQLHAALERLKKVSSLQILFLEQSPFEEPAAYFARTQKIHQALRSRDLQLTASSMEKVADFVVGQYILGINNSSIREQILVGSLKDIYRQHVSLQLALDYEHAVELELFDDGDITDVTKYVQTLRADCGNSASEDLREHMQSLPDPTTVSSLKPRDPYKDKLEFPKTDIGIQCDINFSAQLALHNTLLLRCYAASDVRVQPMILFVKHWAKVRGINVPYRGTLSSYGFVLMVLHYLTNIAQPFVCPNLQLINKDPPEHLTPAEKEARRVCEGRDVRFWRNEGEIRSLAERAMLNHNKDLVGFLLRGFFEYYAQNGQMSTVRERGFDWGREVLSLRRPGGLLTKQEKGWTGAKTVVETSTVAAPPAPEKKVESKSEDPEPPSPMKLVEETKEIRYRYLFAIEDPFELDHNVARTVTHNGIVSIRDEFRRAWRIIKNVGKPGNEELLDPLPEGDKKNGLKEAMDIIYGTEVGGSLPSA